MNTRTIMSIHDDGFGEGIDLAFPTMSSCSACICVLDDRLVGVHKTQGWVPKHDKLFDYAKKLIGTAKVHGLYVAGWNAGTARHDLRQIANALGLTGSRDVPLWSADYTNTTVLSTDTHKPQDAHRTGPGKTKMTDLCTFAFMNGTQAPKVGIKRTSKVTLQQLTDYAARCGDAKKLGMPDNHREMLSYEEVIDTPSSHLHHVTFRSAT